MIELIALTSLFGVAGISAFAFLRVEKMRDSANKRLNEVAKRLDAENEALSELKIDLNDALKELSFKADLKHAESIISLATNSLSKTKVMANG